MKEAGLTHGGFYKHFESRDELLAEALSAALKRASDPQRNPPGDFRSLVERYLSSEHRDAPGTGCAVGALLNDMGRANDEARELYTRKLAANFNGFARLLDSPGGDAREQAILAFSAMVGALGLARAVSDPALSEEILASVRNALLRQVAPAADNLG